MIVDSSSQLLEAVSSNGPSRIVVRGHFRDTPSFRLNPGQSLESDGGEQGCIEFISNADGLGMTRDNRVQGLTLIASECRRAIFNDTTCSSLGRIELKNLRLQGQLQVIAKDRVQQGHIIADGICVTAADTRARDEMPCGNGVRVLQGALTIWNQQKDPDSLLTAELQNISIGSEQTPVLGGGVFLSGSGVINASRLSLDAIEIRSVYADSGLPEGTTDRVAAAVFVLHNARVVRLHCLGAIETFGPNCVGLDNWGVVEDWIAEFDVRSHGPSAIGIVNAGELKSLQVKGVVETFGRGARGMSIYSDSGSFQIGSIVTHGDGASAIHITRPLARLTVGRITTHGGIGKSLVKGVIQTMAADAIDIIESGVIEKLQIDGSVIVHGDGASAFRSV
jgi:hypothetical protein